MATREITITAANAEELAQKAQGFSLGPGDSGHLEIISPRFAGVCTQAFGLEMLASFPGTLGYRFKTELEARGFAVTGKGSLGVTGCDGYIDFMVPVTQAQGPAQMGLAPLAVGLIIGVLTILGLLSVALVLRLTLNLVEEIPGGGLLLALAIVLGLIMLGGREIRRYRQ